MRAKILQSTGSWYQAKTENGNYIHCRLPGRFKLEIQKTTNPIAVGDDVLIHQDSQSGDYVIEEILERKNYFIRQSPRQKHLHHIIASNLDRAIIIFTIAQPRTSLGFLDRFLLVAEMYHIPVTIVVNKMDLLTSREEKKLNEILNIYPTIGYPVITCSTWTREGIEDVKKLVADSTSLIVGHSGVGKSTLINALEPSLQLKTGAISNKWNKGMHTTTFATMYELENDSFIIDTPGIKELFVVDIEPEELSGYFPDLKKWSPNCQYNNCLHENEPHCAVKEAFLNGEIADSRYDSYISILDNIRSVDYWER